MHIARHRPWWLLLGLCACAAGSGTTGAEAGSQAFAPAPAKHVRQAELDAGQLATFWGSPQDEPPARRGGLVPLLEDEHYIVGNEDGLHIFQPAIQGLGGGYVGVGSDQAYLFMDWARVELAWLVDYDPRVLDVHELHRLFFLHAEDPATYMDIWSISARDVALDLIASNHEGSRARDLRTLYVVGAASVLERLERVAREMNDATIACYLTSQERYDFVRTMIRQRRVRPMLVNLLDEAGMKGVAASATALGVPINVLYLSNAEQYWERYSERYRANMAALPFGEAAVVLRTLAPGTRNVQAADNYLRWLDAPYIGNVYHIVERRSSGAVIELTEIWGEPEDSIMSRRQRGELGDEFGGSVDGIGEERH